MSKIPQTFSADHTLTLDAALRDARTQLPRTADAARADRGLVLGLNGHVTLHSPTEAHVTSGSDAEVVYHVSRGGCDCYDACRRLEQRPDAQPGERGCKHWFAAVITAMAHVNLSLKGYVPEPHTGVWYPAVSLDEEWYGHSGYATETEPGLWWFTFADWHGGFYTDTTALELYERTPLHVTEWRGTVTRWSRWLQGA